MTLSPPTEAPCQDWTTIASVRARCGLTVAQAPDPAVTFGIQLASLVLWGASGRRYGLCTRTVRPCHDGDHTNGFHGLAPHPADEYPMMGSSSMVNQLTNAALRGWSICGCWLPELELPGPIASVVDVQYDGVFLPLTAIKIRTAGYHARRSLIRVDGGTWWTCQALNRDPAVIPANPDPECPAWQVTYQQGRAIPPVAVGCADVLTEQFAKALCGGACDNNMVPGLTRVARRGVTREYNPADLVDTKTGQTRTGLPGVDAWIAAVNPHRLTRGASVIRADSPERRRLWSWVDAA